MCEDGACLPLPISPSFSYETCYILPKFAAAWLGCSRLQFRGCAQLKALFQEAVVDLAADEDHLTAARLVGPPFAPLAPHKLVMDTL